MSIGRSRFNCHGNEKMEKVNFKTVGMVLASLLVLFLFVNAIPWAAKSEVQEIREDLKIWYPRIIKMEADIEYLKKGQDEIKANVKEIKELVRRRD